MKTLLEKTGQYKALINAIKDDAILFLDEEGHIQNWNKGAKRLKGYEAEEVLGKHFSLFYNEVDRLSKLPDRLLRDALRNGTVQHEGWRVRKDGSLFWGDVHITALCDESGEHIGFAKVTRDLTKRRISEQALQEMSNNMLLAQHIAHVGNWEWNIATNEMLWSEEVYRILGYEPYEIAPVFDNYLAAVYPDDKDTLEEHIHFTLAGERSYDITHRLNRKDGKVITIKAKNEIHKDTTGRVVKIVGILHDITELKEKEEELSQTIDIISEQNKRLKNFAHIVSHNLRSHVGNLGLMLSLREKAETEEERADIFKHIKSISDNLQETIANLNEVVTIQTSIENHRKKINLYEYTQRTLDMMQGEISRYGVEAHNYISPQFILDYNPAYMESILLNLISNAIKYRDPDKKPMIELGTYQEDNKTVLEVRDNGQGIDLKKHGDKLFGMYKTFHHHPEAKGIGLFITKNQVEAMGGKIEVQSKVKEGTTFKIYLS